MGSNSVIGILIRRGETDTNREGCPVTTEAEVGVMLHRPRTTRAANLEEASKISH